MAILTLKNRLAGKPFIGMFDGQTYEVVDTLAVPDYVAIHLKRQSVYRDNPVTGNNEYRLAIVEHKDDASPLEQLPPESLDRSDMPDFRKVQYVDSGIRPARPQKGTGSGREVVTKER